MKETNDPEYQKQLSTLEQAMSQRGMSIFLPETDAVVNFEDHSDPSPRFEQAVDARNEAANKEMLAERKLNHLPTEEATKIIKEQMHILSLDGTVYDRPQLHEAMRLFCASFINAYTISGIRLTIMKDYIEGLRKYNFDFIPESNRQEFDDHLDKVLYYMGGMVFSQPDVAWARMHLHRLLCCI